MSDPKQLRHYIRVGYSWSLKVVPVPKHGQNCAAHVRQLVSRQQSDGNLTYYCSFFSRAF